MHALLPAGRMVDRFDASYLQDLADILRELYGFTSVPETDEPAAAEVRGLASLTGLSVGDPLVNLAPELRRLGVVEDRFSPPKATQKFKRQNRYDQVPAWQVGQQVVAGPDAGGVDVINELQKEYSILSGGNQDHAFVDLGREATGDPWTPLLQRLAGAGDLRSEEPVLAIGPRWAGEIRYFRDVVGLRGAIGLDLFSRDPALIAVGDMHAMPFPDGTFGVVYQRNTFNKSYDIRRALRECVRVLRDGGVLVSDDCLVYTDGVSELARTSMPSNQWLICFLGETASAVLHDVETPSGEKWFARIGQVAVRIRKA